MLLASPESRAWAPVGRFGVPRPTERRRDRRRAGRRRDADRQAERCRCVEAVAARTFGVDLAELRDRSRGHAPVAFARQVAMYVAHVWFGLSLSAVGRCFGRDRTTVAHACRVVEERREDRRVDRVISAIEAAADLYGDLVVGLEAER
ncbi:MAG: DNA replication initiation protein [Phyllobacteriaceae bacterium]|nr:DNA replication initiation protein [Phyllobacteriaceae bacterium]